MREERTALARALACSRADAGRWGLHTAGDTTADAETHLVVALELAQDPAPGLALALSLVVLGRMLLEQLWFRG